MNSIQKSLVKNEKELPKQISKNLNNKKITQTERKNQKLEEKFYHKIKKKNLHIDNNRNFEISHEKITKHSFHNLKN